MDRVGRLYGGEYWTKMLLDRTIRCIISNLPVYCLTVPGGGYSHTLPIRVCAAQRGRDFEAPDLERGTISEAFLERGIKKLWITALSSA